MVDNAGLSRNKSYFPVIKMIAKMYASMRIDMKPPKTVLLSYPFS
jgi:phage portal protein BeeE